GTHHSSSSTLSLHDSLPIWFRITPVIVLTKHYDMSRTGHATTPFLLFSVYFAVSHFILFKKKPMSIILFVIFLFSGKFREFDYRDRKSTRLNSSYVSISYAV